MPLKNKIPLQYKGFWEIFSLYWEAYGRTKGLVRSPYFHFSLVFCFLAAPLWASGKHSTWFDISLSALPNVLGFTLGGYAILLAFGDERFRNLLSGKDENGNVSPFIGVNATFVHFIVVQVMAILAAVFGSAWQLKTGFFAFFGFLLFCYSIMTALAAAMAILRISNWFDIWSSRKKGQKRPS